MKQQCSTCRFFINLENLYAKTGNDSKHHKWDGLCRRYPPKENPWDFPVTNKTIWCGEWEGKK